MASGGLGNEPSACGIGTHSCTGTPDSQEIGAGVACLVCVLQSGRPSAPTRQHLVHAMRRPSDRTGVSSGRWSTFIVTPWLQTMSQQ